MPAPAAIPLELRDLRISMPYLDQNDQSVKYTEIQAGFFHDLTTGLQNDQGQVALFSWLNKANPDWGQVSPLSPQTVPNIQGVQIIPTDRITQFELVITQKPDNLNYWWNSTDFSKYGFVFPMRLNVVNGSPLWINMPQHGYLLNGFPADSLYINLFPGVQATLNWLQSDAANPPGYSKIPPIQVYSNTSGPNYPLPPDQVPFNAYGPEVLP